MVRGPKFEVFTTSNPELRTSYRTCRAFSASLARLASLKFSSIYPDRNGTGEAGEAVLSSGF